MADFPPRGSQPATPLHVRAYTLGLGLEAQTLANFSQGPPTTTTWVANLVQYNPVSLPYDYPVSRVWWTNGGTVTTTNVDFGIYTADGTRIYNTGSTTMVGVTSVQYVTPTAFVLPAGAYYFAWTCDNTTGRAQTYSGSALASQMVGLLEETTGAFGLPATMTPVSFTRAWGYNSCGLTRTTTGF